MLHASALGHAAHSGTYTYIRGHDINGWETNCGWKNQQGETQGYCPVKPYVLNWLGACSDYPGCQAVVVGPNSPGDEPIGYLKMRPGPTVPSPKWDVFVQKENKR